MHAYYYVYLAMLYKHNMKSVIDDTTVCIVCCVCVFVCVCVPFNLSSIWKTA